jgi:hypothetical protein
MKLLDTEIGKNSFGPYRRRLYSIGTAHKKNVLLRHCQSWFKNKFGKCQEHWEVKLEGACCWIGVFRTACTASAFYGIKLS